MENLGLGNRAAELRLFASNLQCRVSKIAGGLFGERTVCLTSYILFLAVGLAIFGDFGVSWDEYYHLELGKVVFDHVFKGAPLISSGDTIYYGPVFDFFAHLITQSLSLEDSRDILLTKHLLNFLFFAVAVFFFYRLCRSYFERWEPAYIACLFLVIHPRIFADSFYNPKDLPFLSSFVIACFTLQWLMERKTVWRSILHGLACAICTDVRVLGVLIPLFTITIAMLEVWQSRFEAKTLKELAVYLPVYLVATVCFSILFWPYLWESPLTGLVTVLELMSHHPHLWPVLYWGDYFQASQLPWHYIPVWIAITTPISILALCLVGILDLPLILGDLAFRTGKYPSTALLPYLWFLVPVVGVIAAHSTVYNGWRHLYFVYPAIVMISIRGALRLWSSIAKLPQISRIGIAFLVIALVFDLLSVTVFMARSHPNEYLYFNPLVGQLKGTKGKFEWDYFGLSNRQLLECLIRTHPGPEPALILGCEPTYYNISILPAKDRKRLQSAGIIHVSGRYIEPQGLSLDKELYYLTDLPAGVVGWMANYPTACLIKEDGAPIAGAIQLGPTTGVNNMSKPK